MSDSIHQWILKDLKQYAEDWGASMSKELMRLPKGRQCQLVKFITPPTDNRSAAIWGYVSDKECWIPVRFEPKAMALFSSGKDPEPLTSYLGSVCTLRKITLKFTKVPLEGKIGLDKEDQLVLLVGEVTINGARGEPAFRMDVQDKNGLWRRGKFIVPDDNPTIGRWVNGLRTGNGHILQIERMQKNASAELEGRGPTASLSQPPTPRALTSGMDRNETRKVFQDWRMPADQKELIERYNGRGPSTPASDVFSDDESDEERPGLTGINNPNVEPFGSPATVIYSGWSSTPVRAPAFPGEEVDEEEEEDADNDGEDNEDTLGRVYSGEHIPCAQPPKLRSTFSLTFESNETPKEEPFTQILPPALVPRIPEDVSQPSPRQPSLSYSWPTFPSTVSKDPETTNPGQKDKDSQLSSISTIEPTSSNNLSCSALYPPAQRSFRVTESQESRQDTESERGSTVSSVSSFHSAVQSQLSQLGGVGEEPELEPDDEAERRPTSPHAENEGEAAGFPDITTRSPSPPRGPEVGSVFDDSKRSSVTPDLLPLLKLGPSPPRKPEVGSVFDVTPHLGSLSKLDDLQLPKYKRPDRKPDLMVVAPLVRDGHGLVKRRLPEWESSVEGANKRLKSEQAARRGREASAASLLSHAAVTPRTSDSFIEDHRSSSSKNVPRPSGHRRPLLVGNGKDLTLWSALRGNPPPPPPKQRQQANRPGFLLADNSHTRPPLLDFRKMKLGVRRSDKYRKSQDPLSQ